MSALDKASKDAEEGRIRAAAVRAANGPEVAARVDAFTDSVPDLVRRTYVSPDNGKGRQTFWVAPPDNLSPQFGFGKSNSIFGEG